MPVMDCPACGAVIPLGVLAARCNACGFNGSILTLDDVRAALEEGAAERRAAERIRKRAPRR